MGMTRGAGVTTRARGLTRGVTSGAEKEGDTGRETGGAGSKDAPRQPPTTQEG